MKRHAALCAAALVLVLPALAATQNAQYPITLIPPASGSPTYPPGYQTPWDKIEIRVTEKLSPNLFVLHGSPALDPAHPDASGGRAMALFGPDGVLMVDSENRQVGEKTLAAVRSFTDAPIRVLVNTHIHSDHTGANAVLRAAGRPHLRAGEPPQRDAAAAVAWNAAGAQSGRRAEGHVQVQPGNDWRAGGHVPHERRDRGLHSDDALAHRGRHHRPVPERERDLHRGLLSQLRLSVRRPAQRRLDQRHGRGGGSDRPSGRPGHDARAGPRHARQEGRPARRIARCSSTSSAR